jgi:glycosyltransferase involved in cell wall biosynthesis
MTRWLLISGDFTPLGGMDRANHALARTLSRRADTELHIVAHRVWDDVASGPHTRVHLVRRPAGSHLLGAPLLAAAGAREARRLAGAHVVANGGNADAGDVCWVHYVHAGHAPVTSGVRRTVQSRVAHRYYESRERRALQRARLVICNSARSASDVTGRLDVDPSRVRVIYYGSDPAEFSPVDAPARAAARRALGWPEDRLVAVFVGALGDRRKGFDRLLEAWQFLCLDSGWDVDLAVAGGGSEARAWQRRAAESRARQHVRFVGFRRDIATIVAASDLMVHPARYEAYGLGVHEAICRGLPAIVSASAGIAELYPQELARFLIEDVENASEIADRVHRWRWDVADAAARVRPLSERLRSRSWDDMAAEVIAAVEA